MQAVILVGGYGTRLRPLTASFPKQMLTVAHRPMIERVVEHLVLHGVTEVVLSMGFQPDVFKEHYLDDVCAGIAVHYAVEPEPLDTGGAIGFAARHANIDGTFLACNGDVLTDLDVSAVLASHRASETEATIALTPVEHPENYGVVLTGHDERVRGFLEKPKATEISTNLINAGVYVFEPAVLERIPEGQSTSLERETFPAMVDSETLAGVAVTGYWMDCGTPANYLEANLHFAKGLVEATHARAVVDSGAQVYESVIAPRVSVCEGASIKSSLVLEGATIGENSLVEGSIVGPRAHVAAGATITGLSLVGPDSVVEEGVRLDGALWPQQKD